MKSMKSFAVAAAVLLSAPAMATDYSFTGAFTQDDDVQLFTFTVGATSTVTLRTWSYAGGTNAAGQSIARGGFDPILALFDSTGTYINQNDDGGCGLVAQDLSGRCWDTYFSATLDAGTYTVSVMQFDNFALGPNLSNGFTHDGDGNFTGGFIDVSGSQYNHRDGHWAFDILNVAEATQNAVPEPASWALMIAGLGLAGAAMRRRARVAFATA